MVVTWPKGTAVTKRFPRLLEFAHTEQYERELKKLISNSVLREAADETIIWALIRKPNKGISIPRTSIWIYPLVVRGSEYVVFYKWEDLDKVELLSIRIGIIE